MKSKKYLLAGSILAMIAGGLLLAAKSPVEARNERIARGKYLATFGDCATCHTPVKLGPNGPEPDLTRMFAGHPEDANFPPPPKLGKGPWFAATGGFTAWTGPWGISYAANLTPDKASGIGIWTEDMFIKAMRTGKHFGAARDILPPMPWRSVGSLNDEDLKALFAYFRSLPPVRNHVPQPVPPGGPQSFE